jgi:hypothetical protein
VFVLLKQLVQVQPQLMMSMLKPELITLRQCTLVATIILDCGGILLNGLLAQAQVTQIHYGIIMTTVELILGTELILSVLRAQRMHLLLPSVK